MPIRTPHAFTLDIVKPTKIPIMEFYQTDVNTAQMDISITNNDEVVDLTGHTLILNIKKSDNTEIQNLATISDATKGLVNISLTTQSLTAIGECRVQLTIFEGTNRKSVHEFKYYVKASLLNAEVPLSSNEYGLLLQLIDDVQEVENILNTSEAERVQAENLRETNENNREILKGQLDTLKTELESLQDTLNTLNTNVESNETTRQTNEEARQTLKGQLDTLKTTLEDLQTNLIYNENIRIDNEADRQTLKGQLESLQSTLEALESTLNINDTTRTNAFNTKVTEVNNKITEATNSIADIENRFALLTTSQQQASEVINARTSTIRNRTFADLDSRLEETEKDILTSQATSVIDSVVPVNHLTNAMDGATDLTVKGMSLVNIVKNGNFVNTSGWSSLGVSSFSASSNEGIFTASSSFGGIKQTYQTKTGNKYFFVVTLYGATSVKFEFIDSAKRKSVTQANTYQKFYDIVTETNGQNRNIDVFDVATNGWTTSKAKEIMIIDLTALGLESKSADEINAMLPSYFEGIGSVEGGVVKSIGKNIFGGILEIGGISTADGTNTVNTSYLRNADYVKIKPTETYKISSIGSNTVLNTYWYFYDTNKKFISYVIGSSQTIPSNCAYIRFALQTQAVAVLSGAYVQIEKGTVATPYESYKESKIQLSDYIEAQYFPLRSVSPTVYDEVNTSGKLYKRINKVVLNGSESWAIWTSGVTHTNTVGVILTLPNKLGLGVLADKLTSYDYQYFWGNEVEGISGVSDNRIVLRINKTKLATQDVAGVKTYLSQNNLEVLYQLATPTEVTLDRKIDLPIYKNGTIIQEPTKLYSKLSYIFPLNMGRSVESIVNNLAIVKDNQQFIMSYLLDLDTRLTLGGH